MTITKRLARGAVAMAFTASLAASNGNVVIGTTATNGDIHVNTATSDPDSGGQGAAAPRVAAQGAAVVSGPVIGPPG